MRLNLALNVTLDATVLAPQGAKVGLTSEKDALDGGFSGAEVRGAGHFAQWLAV